MFFNPFSASIMEVRNIYSSMKPIYQRIDWRKHLVPNHHSWISEYMDTHGVDFYARTADIINEGWKRNKKQVVIDDLNKLLSEIPKDNRNLQAQIKLCLERIMQPNKFDYKNKMDEIYSRYERPWTQIHEDLA